MLDGASLRVLAQAYGREFIYNYKAYKELMLDIRTQDEIAENKAREKKYKKYKSDAVIEKLEQISLNVEDKRVFQKPD